jgi:hypothetical protein
VTNRLTDFQVCDFALHWTCMDTSPISGLWFWCVKHRRTIFLHRYAIWTVSCKLLQVEKQLKSSSNGEPLGRNERWGLKGRTDSLQAGQGVEWKANKQRDKAGDLNPGCYKSEQTWLEILRDSLLLLIPLTEGTVRLKKNRAQCVGWLEWQSSAWLMIKRNTTQLQQ